MVSPYPPVRDGIAAYALQSVGRLRAEGHEVEVLSPHQSAAHHYLDLAGWRGPLALAKRVRRYERVIVQFHPDMFYPIGFGELRRAIITAGLIVAFLLARDLEVRIHEIDYRLGRRPGPDALLQRLLWRIPNRLAVHTEVESGEFAKAFGVPRSKIEVTLHGADFVLRTKVDKKTARASLGVPQDAYVFLSIGFIQPHKGFDRAIKAFRNLGVGNCRLYVVGSVRVESLENMQHLQQLELLAQRTPGATVRAGYLSDDAFDRWIVAADMLVLPYRHIWSSSVLARAALYGRPVIATKVGGLADQAPPGTILVDGDEDLAAAMRSAAGKAVASRETSGVWEFPAGVDREVVLTEIRARAALQRPAVDGSGSSSVRATKLRRLPALAPPPPTSRRLLGRLAKRFVRRLTAWEIEPLVTQVNELRRAMIEVAAEEPTYSEKEQQTHPEKAVAGGSAPAGEDQAERAETGGSSV